jgi:hypothetical protein
MLNELQHRLQEPSAVMSAAEGLDEWQKMLIAEREVTAEIAKLEKIQKDYRQQLMARFNETGEKVSVGAYHLEPTRREIKKYNTAKFVEMFPDFKSCLKVDGTLVAAYEKNGQLPGIENCRAVEVSWAFGVKGDK